MTQALFFTIGLESFQFHLILASGQADSVDHFLPQPLLNLPLAAFDRLRGFGFCIGSALQRGLNLGLDSALRCAPRSFSLHSDSSIKFGSLFFDLILAFLLSSFGTSLRIIDL